MRYLRRLAPVVVLGGVVLSSQACSDVAVGDASPDAGGDAAAPNDDASPATADGGAGCATEDGGLCGFGAACANDDDCQGKCSNGTCTRPTHDDGKRSTGLGETDVDCGGPTAPPCGDAQGCAVDRDCSSQACSTLTKRCVAGRSCIGGSNGPSGLETCGSGEPGESGALHESCCRSLPLPVRKTRRLDRYEITSGRLRAFIDAVTAASGGVPNLRAWAKAYAAAHPKSQLADVAVGYPGVLDILPDHAGAGGMYPLPVFLGAFPLDPQNELDGCTVGPGAYGHPTYWQPPEDLKPFGLGYPDAQGVPDGTRKYSREALDAKSVNCVMPLMLAAFCAWDGGELARTNDFHEVWGRRPTVVGAATIYIPWAAPLSVGQYNFRNGHGAVCNLPYPGCVDPQPYFYGFPQPHEPADDDTPAIAAPGRFPLDVTAIRSANGEGWYDIAANMVEAAWLTGPLRAAPTTQDICDVSASPGPGETGCIRRDRAGVLRRAGPLPGYALLGYSFEGHERRGEDWVSASIFDESLAAGGDVRPLTFQYGKIGGRCARPGL